MEITKNDMQSLHMLFSVVEVEKVMSEESKIWFKDFKERLVNALQESA